MAEDKKTPEDGAQKKGKMKLILIIVAALVVLGGGGGAALLLMGGGSPAEAQDAESEEASSSDDAQYLLTMDSYVVNLADPKGDRFMKATLRLVVTDPALEERLREDGLFRARLRDKAISVLSSKQFKDLNTPLGKEALRRELTREFNQIFPAGSVKEVLFVEFVIQ